MKKILLFLLAIVILVSGLGYFLYNSNMNYVSDPQSSDRVSVHIREGSNAASVALLLKEKELIQSTPFFRFYVKQNKVDHQIKSGQFVFQKNNTLEEIVEILLKGEGAEMKVTLLEGWTARQIGEKLEAQGLTSVENFMDCIETCDFKGEILPEGYVEGYLYPDTYFVNPVEYTDKAFIERLIRTLDQKLTSEDWAGIENGPHTFEEIMIMASIVEREERVDRHKPVVAGVLWNRFDARTGLGADATVLYGLGRTSGGLTYNDLQSTSPYNTRKYAGLPPTPIANPSLSSIRAAIFPEETDYWYYLHDPQGNIHYGKTLEEHNINKNKYLR